MQIKRIGQRTLIFSFPELEQVNLLAVYGKTYTYLCDTFLGPVPMEEIKSFFSKENRNQPIVVFNSHWDWDHVWGNCAFPSSMIVGHKLCRENLEKGFWSELERNKQHVMGDVKPLFPNVLFTDRLSFPEDEVEFIHTPGHTNDSSSCYDKKEDVLYVGDNVEYPIPYVSDRDIKTYISTLEKYLEWNPSYIVTGHGNIFTMELIQSNLAYLKSLISNEHFDQSNWNEEIKQRHQLNIEMIKEK